MIKCKSCSENYAEAYRFCPYCGQPKLSPQGMAEAHADPKQQEEATLRLRYTIAEQVLNEGIGWFGRPYQEKCYMQVGHIELVAMNHDKGEYIALTSKTIRGLQPTNPHGSYTEILHLGNILDLWKDALDHLENSAGSAEFEGESPKVEAFCKIIQERKNVWNLFCVTLKNEGWYGITDDAIKRTMPFNSAELVHNLLNYGYHGYERFKEWKKNPHSKFDGFLDDKKYRYRRNY